MIKYSEIYLVTFIALMVSCTNSNRSREYTTLDSTWLEFATAIEQRDIGFLITHSLDSIQCVDCTSIEEATENEVYPAQFLLYHHLEDFAHLKDLKKDFGTWEDDSLVRVTYTIEWAQAETGRYNLVFTLVKQNGKYLLSDRFFIP